MNCDRLYLRSTEFANFLLPGAARRAKLKSEARSFYPHELYTQPQITIAQVYEKGQHPLSSPARRLGLSAIRIIITRTPEPTLYRGQPHSHLPPPNPYRIPPQSTLQSYIPLHLNPPPLWRLATRSPLICPNPLIPSSPQTPLQGLGQTPRPASRRPSKVSAPIIPPPSCSQPGAPPHNTSVQGIGPVHYPSLPPSSPASSPSRDPLFRPRCRTSDAKNPQVQEPKKWVCHARIPIPMGPPSLGHSRDQRVSLLRKPLQTVLSRRLFPLKNQSLPQQTRPLPPRLRVPFATVALERNPRMSTMCHRMALPVPSHPSTKRHPPASRSGQRKKRSPWVD